MGSIRVPESRAHTVLRDKVITPSGIVEGAATWDVLASPNSSKALALKITHSLGFRVQGSGFRV